MLTVEIQGAEKQAARREVEGVAGSERIYRKGTNEALYLDCLYRDQADLLIVNLRLIPGVKARICGE